MHFAANKENFYAFALSIAAGFSSDKALSKMGLLKTRSESQKASHPSKISPNEREKVKRLYWEEDMTVTEIAKIYECSATTVLKYLNENSIEVKSRGRKRIEV
ncbi:helix-turn-helix domain-containing protein [Clostridium magnum]|nr:helix-turn-helix domain-containing protein [Clostridium magnum]